MSGWAPYCLKCDTMGRMSRIPGGWKCEGVNDPFGRAGCGNEIDVDFRPKKKPLDIKHKDNGDVGN